MLSDYFVVAEALHEIQNPTSEEKLLLLGKRLGLGPDSRVLEVASGRGGPALLLAREFGCTIHGIEIRPGFHTVAVERIAAAGLEELVTFELGDASKATRAAEPYDAALCLGASFVYGSLADTVDALAPVVRPGGYVAVGEPYWRRLPLPDDYEDRDEPWTSLEGTVRILETSGIRVVSVIASSEEDWDRYETLHWQALERWLAANPDDPDAGEIRARHEQAKWNYLRHQRDYLGWAIFVGRCVRRGHGPNGVWRAVTVPATMVSVDGLIEREDVDAILSGIFDINASLVEIRDEVKVIRQLLEDDDEEEEEEDDSGHSA